MRRNRPFSLLSLLLSLVVGGIASGAPAEEPAPREAKSLFDGRSLGAFKPVEGGEFEGRGEVKAADSSLVLERGKPATGVRYTGEFPRHDYEVTLEARRAAGDDFFCGMTFPVGEKEGLTLILGGWGGWVTGLSRIDGRYAIDNDTCGSVKFENGRWYRVRLRVAGGKVLAWVDDQPIIDFETADHELSLSEEMEPCGPFGFATWNTRGELRKIQVKTIPANAAP